MEVSSVKTLSSDQLPTYWNFLQRPLVNYIAEIHSLPGSDTVPDTTLAVRSVAATPLHIYPNPAVSTLHLAPTTATVTVSDIRGRELLVMPQGTTAIDVSHLPAGLYILRSGDYTAKFLVRRQ